jgi:hypothetical protein
MAIKTFTTGEVLTAADTNTYLANSGLVYIKGQTVGSGVSSVSVNSVFSSTYDNYEIVYSGGTSSTSNNLNLALNGQSSNYYNVLLYGSYTATGPSIATTNNDRAFWPWVGGGFVANGNFARVTLLSPFEAKYTRITSPTYQGDTNSGFMSGINKTASSATGFTITSDSGTISGGTILVYGYRYGTT